MKKILLIILSICLISLCACSTNDKETTNIDTEKETTSIENVYTGELTEPISINSEEDVVITLKDVTADMTESVIDVENANSVTLILEGENTLKTSGEDVKTIVSDCDLTIKGEGSLSITSDDTAIKSKDNLTIESGTYTLITDGDGLRANETLTINGGTITINATEGIESTEIIINDGNISISASDDGLNASIKSEEKSPLIEINGGTLEITMGNGDTDALDSNGDLIINGGKITISAQFAFDFAGKAELNGGEVYVNREKVTEITNSMNEGMGHGGGMQPGEMPQNGNMPQPPTGN